jgi:hypothetical protein
MDDAPIYNDELDELCLDCIDEDEFDQLVIFDDLMDDNDNLTHAGFDHLADLEKEMLS